MRNDPIHMTTALPIGSLDAYLYQIEQIPVLSAEEEHILGCRFHEDGDLKAAQQLVLSHLRYVVRIAKQYHGYGLGIADLLQEGTIGLMKAVKRFDPYKGIRLVTFAVHWIKSEIHDFVIRNWRIVKMATTKAQRKLFFNLRRYRSDRGWLTREEVAFIAKDLQVPETAVIEMEQRLYQTDLAYDLPVDEETIDTPTLVPADYLTGPRSLEPLMQLEQDHFSAIGREKLLSAMEKLDERSATIIQSRWLQAEKVSLKTLAERFQISIERVRQLEEKALKTLAELVSAA